ncbi:MAG: hypothetical protein HY842_12190 [Bacteroidetes bacterium]|nr:hypothetical protein [Bacteroidota bacterium]
MHRYKEAIKDYDYAIELEPELSTPYFGKAQALLYARNDTSAVHLYFNRFIFLAAQKEIIKFWKRLQNFYANHAGSPFLEYRLLEMLPEAKDFISWQGVIHETERQCRVLKKYLYYLHDAGVPERDALQYHHLEALVNYYMGDPMKAYRIYDEIIDGELESINLMGSYYFVRSAMNFMEPYENILDFALEQAEQFLENFLPERDLCELYYAGQLFALKEDWEKALQAFQKAEELLPAAVMQLIAAENVGKSEGEIEMLTEKARKLTLSLSEEENYLNGFPKVWLDIEREDFLTSFQQYAYYQEILEHLYLIQEEEAPFQHREFWEVWQLSPTDEEKIWWHYREKELKKIEAELQSFFTQNLEAQYADYMPEQLQNLEKLLSEKVTAVQAVFEKLKTKSATGSEALEHQIGLEIDGWQLRHPHTYALMLKYFFLSDQLAPKATFLLYFYNDFKASEKQKDYSSGKAAYTKGAQKFLEIILKPIWMLGDVGLAAVAAALAELSRQFFLQNPSELDEADVISNYEKFKTGFLKFLSFEMESMGREKFFQKYPLEGWEDWKK